MINRFSRKKTAPPSHTVALALTLLGGALVLFVGGYFAFTWCQRVWQEQACIQDENLDVVVTITPGKMVTREILVGPWGFCLTNGANLATIDYGALRAKLLRERPALADIRILRNLPDRVTLDVTERVPVARLFSGQKTRSGRVVDQNGIVFECRVDTQTLPILREKASLYSRPGQMLSPQAAAALRLLQMVRLDTFKELLVDEVDATRAEAMLLTFRSMDRAKFAWAHMLEASDASQTSLSNQLWRLSRAMATRIAPPHTLWIATDQGEQARIYASDRARDLVH